MTIVATACFGSTGATTTTVDTTMRTTSAPVVTTTIPDVPLDPGTYRVGVLEEFTSSNSWAMLGPDAAAPDAFLLDSTKPSLYTISHPGFETINDLAVPLRPPLPTRDGDIYSVTVPIRQDAVWSDRDRTPITAYDIEFTARAVRDLGLGDGWAEAYPWAGVSSNDVGLIDVTAIDDHTVRFSWDGPPGYATWPHAVGRAPIMPRHYWEDAVAAATAAVAPAEHLYSTEVINDPSGGPLLVIQWNRDLVQTTANEDFYDRGRQIASGGVSYRMGPFFAAQVFRVFSSPGVGFEALRAGDVDFLPTQVSGDHVTIDGVSIAVNLRNGFAYLAFDRRHEPMSRKGFRDALTFMIDKEHVAGWVLQGVVQPEYATVPAPLVDAPQSGHPWHDPERVALFSAMYTEASTDVRHDGEPFVDSSGSPYRATGFEARLHLAVSALKTEGFSWPRGEEPDFRDDRVIGGSGIMIDGRPVGPLAIGAPGPGIDPLIATYALIVEQLLDDLGFEAEVERIEAGDESDEPNAGFDIHLDRAILGDPAVPNHHREDAMGLSRLDNPELDRLVDGFDAAMTREDAYEAFWQIEAFIAEQKPYLALFSQVLLDAYRPDSIRYPFTQVLGGLRIGFGYPALVTPAEG